MSKCEDWEWDGSWVSDFKRRMGDRSGKRSESTVGPQTGLAAALRR